MSTRIERMKAKLETAFAPQRLEIEDQSGRHANHGERMGLKAGETHYAVTMMAQSLRPLSRVERSRAVHEALKEEFETGLHALSLNLSVPE
jgi:BolA protein